jgi:hypothetical protein
MHLFEGDYAEAARWANRAHAIDPAHRWAWKCVGLVAHASCDWAGYWRALRAQLDCGFMFETVDRRLGGVPYWDGSRVDCLAVHAAGGIGEEIAFASLAAETATRVGRVVLECSAKLARLFTRSLPLIEVHGTRDQAAPAWSVNRKVDARLPCLCLGEFFRPGAESFPRVPYLLADAALRRPWRALFDSWGKPAIGLAWSGGANRHSYAPQRHIGLEAFGGLITNTDAAFVSLEYRDGRAEIERSGLPVHQFEQTLASCDYDETAALVAELDFVIGPPASIHYLAGALGRPSLLLVPSLCPTDVASGNRLAWFAEQVYHRQRPGESWRDCIARLDWSQITRRMHRAGAIPT